MSVLGDLTKGILADYLGKTFSRKDLQEATARIVKSYLMTREGANLPKEGSATNFSDNEVKGEEKKTQKTQQEIDREEFHKKHKVKAIISQPGLGEDGDAAPVSYWTKK